MYAKILKETEETIVFFVTFLSLVAFQLGGGGSGPLATPMGLLRLSAGTYEATSSTAANVVCHLKRFRHTSVQFGNVGKAFFLSLRGKIIANILRSLGRRESKLVRKNSKKVPKLFHYGFTAKFFKQNVLNALLGTLEEARFSPQQIL